MNRKKVFIVIVVLLIIVFAAVYYFVFKQNSISSSDRKRVDRLFSDSEYLKSQVGESFWYDAKNACDPFYENAKKYNWTESTDARYFDGGSVGLRYHKNGVTQIIKVHCKWDMSKGYDTSATVNVE